LKHRNLKTLLLATACAAGVSAMALHVVVAAEAPTPTAPSVERPLGPPPGIGQGLEGSSTEAPEQREEDKPLVPVPAPGAKSATQVPDMPSRTRMLLGEIEILDIPLDQIPNYRDSMREIIEELALYAHGRDPKFIVTTRGGFDLLAWSRREFDLAEIKRDPLARIPGDAIMPIGMPMRRYIQQLDGFVLNGQFCAPLRVPRDDLQAMVKMGLKALSIEHCRDIDTASAALRAAIQTSVVAHIDIDDSDIFAAVPRSRPAPENSGNVQVLGAARNMLVMLDTKGYESKEEWLAALQATNYDTLIVDAFYKGDQALTKNEVHSLKFKEMGARRLVLARMSTGYAEDERYYWKREWRIGEPSWIQALGQDRPGQYVVEYWNPAWKAIVGKYFAGIMDLGFDGVVLDGVEAYRRWEFMTPLDPISK